MGISHIKSGLTTIDYYKSMNDALRQLNDEYTMLHYPYYISDKDSFFKAQKNLTDYCLSKISAIEGKDVLEIGCGNGVQACYFYDKHSPATLTAIDINDSNITLAKKEAERRGLDNINFMVNSAQDLAGIDDESVDVVINIESAFHYPDKVAFLKEVKRVLKPGGNYIIADILTFPRKRTDLGRRWKKKMSYFHWTREQYETNLKKVGLETTNMEDITLKVIKGFQLYRIWIKGIKKIGFFKGLILKTFFTINVRLNIWLLQTRRQYFLIAGHKPA